MPERIYKPVPAADVERFIAVEAQAFHDNPDLARVTPASFDQLRGLYAGGQLVAQLQLLPHQVLTAGAPVASGGIASVATPPEQRRRGYAAELLRHVCAELHERGIWLSMLFPYDRSFYHRFGWATAMERNVYNGAPQRFKPTHVTRPQEWGFEPVGDAAIGQLQTVYRAALRGRFGPLVRDEAHWAQQVLRDWTNKPNQALLWRDQAGKARAYLIAAFEPDGGGEYLLRVREAVALDPEARAQIFVLLADYAGQVTRVVLPTPPDAPVAALLPDPPRCEVEPGFMLRLVDVQAALAAAAYPKHVVGRLTLAVADDWLAHNQGIFALEVAEGQASCQRVEAATADLSCDVRSLTQIYTRYLRPRQAAAFGLLEVRERAALELFERLFGGLAAYCSDYF